MKQLTYTSIYSDAHGQSHFRECEVPLEDTIIGPLIPPLGATISLPAVSYYFLTFPPGMHADWHPAPKRLFHFFLTGGCEVVVSDGEVRHFKAGDIVLAEDTTGQGHTTSNHGLVETLMAVVALPDTLLE
jgi:hypothetical protein